MPGRGTGLSEFQHFYMCQSTLAFKNILCGVFATEPNMYRFNKNPRTEPSFFEGLRNHRSRNVFLPGQLMKPLELEVWIFEEGSVELLFAKQGSFKTVVSHSSFVFLQVLMKRS